MSNLCALRNLYRSDEAGSTTLTDSPDQNGSRDRLEILVEPGHGALDEVPAVRGVREVVPFVRINHQPCGHAERSQRVPEFVRLGRRTFPVAVAHGNQSRRSCMLDERNR